MYAKHQSAIARFAMASPDNLARIMQFVILTIRQPLHRIEGDFETVDRGGPDAIRVLFGYKFHAYNEAWINRNRHAAYVNHVLNWRHGDCEAALLEYFADQPGFGLPKSGFVVQLIATGLGGCLDTHNIKRFGISPRSLEGYKRLKTPRGRAKAVARYQGFLASAGGPEVLWNTWCQYVAETQPKAYPGGCWAVSATHCDALNLEEN